MQLIRQIVYHLLHPALLLGAIGVMYWLANPALAYLVCIIGAQIILRTVEYTMPAHPEWRQTGGDIAEVALITFISFIFVGVADAFYDLAVGGLLIAFDEQFGLLWPVSWPLFAQVLLAYFLAEFVFYWLHRGIHNSAFLWRLSGHGCHHAFHNLHAINFLTAHPMEVFFLAIPQLVIAALLGAPPEAALGGLTLVVVNAAVAHGNVNLNPASVLGIFTSGVHHRRHHSQILAESNSNYSCNAIVFDRLFGTFSSGPVTQTGIGPSEPGLLDKLLINFREPADIQIAPRQRTSATKQSVDAHPGSGHRSQHD